MAKPIPTVEQAQAGWFSDENTGVTTTAVRKTVPGGAAYLDICLFSSTATPSTALWLFIALNADSNSHEDDILAGASPSAIQQRIRLPRGLTNADMLRVVHPNGDPITRYAFRTDAATESVGNIVVQRVGSLL